jgi:uncharacterized damage-inducible protein DinB
VNLKQTLVPQLRSSLKYFQATASTFTEEDSGFAPQPELFTVAGHVAHAADSVDWFVEGAFGEGWNMDFEGMIAAVKAVTSLDEANAWLERAYEAAIAAIESATEEELLASIADKRIMGGAPRYAIVNSISDHSAHHRGALTVYARLTGKTPKMPYS